MIIQLHLQRDEDQALTFVDRVDGWLPELLLWMGHLGLFSCINGGMFCLGYRFVVIFAILAQLLVSLLPPWPFRGSGRDTTISLQRGSSLSGSGEDYTPSTWLDASFFNTIVK